MSFQRIGVAYDTNPLAEQAENVDITDITEGAKVRMEERAFFKEIERETADFISGRFRPPGINSLEELAEYHHNRITEFLNMSASS